MFINTGLVMMLLPLGIFLRSMPYMRTLGGLLIAVALSFMVIYPLMLASFSLIFDSLFKIPDPLKCYIYNEGQLESAFVRAKGLDPVKPYSRALFFEPGDPCDAPTKADTGSGAYDEKDPNELEAMKLAGSAFLAGVFFPTIAMLGAVANVRFITRLLGEDIDLSRIIQMM